MSIETRQRQPVEIAPIDFDHEATVAFWLNKDLEGNLIYESGQDAVEFARAFSLMKFGHMPSVRFFADKLARSAISDQKFINFVKNNPGQLFICSPGIYNIPSSSNLLLTETATRINAFLSTQGLPTMIVKPLTRLGESSLNYAETTLADRGVKKGSQTVMPTEFKNNPVIYLDDIKISGTVLERNNQRLQEEAGVSALYFLVVAGMNEEVVAATDGKIEHELNTAHVDGGLCGGFLDVISSDFVVVQKTLKVFLDPANLKSLQTELADRLGEGKYKEVLLKIYLAATANDFWQRYEGIYVPALEFIRTELLSRGLVDSLGLPIEIGENEI